MKKKQAFNPFLPSYEYVPDGEPHVFGDRVYLYGSHDKFGAPIFCVNDYVCWSASISDLSEWRMEGVIYSRKQDPHNKLGIHSLYAPDVVRGNDGRYYLYYALDFKGEMGVAVSDEPASRFEFYGYVHFKDGHIWGSKSKEPFPFDPGVINDNGKIYLYSGFATKIPFFMTKFRNLTNEGGVVLELESDMVTIKSGPELLFPRKGKKGSFQGHSFFEASSIRKIDEKYCFVYSSEHNHELCYAMSENPKGPFTYGGTLIDLGDLFIDGNNDRNMDESHGTNYLGNTHGGLLKNGDDWYIFYHRQTNKSSYARQACAEKLRRNMDGSFAQSEVTSCGLNNGPLDGIGEYEARIACNLWSEYGTGRYDCFMHNYVFRKHPYFTQHGKDRDTNGNQYIANMRNGAVAGFKYFQLGEAQYICLEVSGKACGNVIVAVDSKFSDIVATIPINSTSMKTKKYSSTFLCEEKIAPLFFKFTGKGAIHFYSFALQMNIYV